MHSNAIQCPASWFALWYFTIIFYKYSMKNRSYFIVFYCIFVIPYLCFSVCAFWWLFKSVLWCRFLMTCRLPMAKWQNCRWRRMAKLAKWAKWVKWAIRIAPILGSKHKTRNYFINSDHWNERIAYLHHKEILSNWNHLKMHCLLKFEHISWDSSEKSISCFQSLTNNSKVQTVHQLIDWKVRQSNANNCINPGNNLEQFGGGRMGGSWAQGVWSLNVIKDKTNIHVV